MLRKAHLTLLLPLALACTRAAPRAATPAGGPEPTGVPAPMTASADLITRAEIAAGFYRNAYDLVQAMHANWLQARGKDTILGEPTQVRVYLDGMRYGDPPSLRDLLPSSIESIRFISGIDASGRWGLDHGAGVIFVTTRTR